MPKGDNMFTCKECSAKAGQPTNKSRKLSEFKHRKNCSQHPGLEADILKAVRKTKTIA